MCVMRQDVIDPVSTKWIRIHERKNTVNKYVILNTNKTKRFVNGIHVKRF